MFLFSFNPHSAQQKEQFHALQKAASPLIYEPFYFKHNLLLQFCLLLVWEKAPSHLTHCRAIQFSCNIHLVFLSISRNVGDIRIRSEIVHVEWSWESCHQQRGREGEAILRGPEGDTSNRRQQGPDPRGYRPAGFTRVAGWVIQCHFRTSTSAIYLLTPGILF